LFDTHFAWIYQPLLTRFDEVCLFSNRTEWIKEKVKEDFGLSLKGKSDLLVLDNLVKNAYYIDKTDWLREKMRNEIKEND
jgi:PHD/YefM family antitoxin component YafN of YafNO toxin-antitoxin module